MTRFWVSWYFGGEFEYHGPWWRSGFRELDDGSTQDTICAAVLADSEDHAMNIIAEYHDEPVVLEWRFCEPREDDWEPFCDRFRRADWMKWPWPEHAA